MPADRSLDSRAGAVGLLISGGLDSCILLARLLERGWRVQPFYIESGLAWQETELRALRQFLAAVKRPSLAPLVVLDLPLQDVYGGHWSVTGEGVPSADEPDEAVYLPGRNALLVIKAALWCQLNGIGELALAPLRSNPFADATPEFFDEFESALNRATCGQVRLVRPFDRLGKQEVMQLGREYPLELTFSCISPQGGLHCGVCNKCHERRRAFGLLTGGDPTAYARSPSGLAAR